ncbi:hypothetical protein BWQ96_05889 [Gracilariopsis chorda]|uniref:Uncharacterized protein n=1 Tax=Gracilariopsis chorda TaxID=448386 RepID=A0A2V3IQL0_9FLOR|nr:hypothetical protein BWQ96_05889 [Gracilariopsis chorda]|eukprot:PXF44369.1 hypothetical protein BWQ96_05889 [Gracilariopsis chorda]
MQEEETVACNATFNVEEEDEDESQIKDFIFAGGDEAVSYAKTLQALAKDLEDQEDEEEVAFAKGNKKKSFEFEVHSEEVEHVKRQAIALDYVLMKE